MLHKHFNYDLKKMFYEKDQSGKCYKSFAKWDMPFDREQVIHELIIKRQIEANSIENEQV